MGRTVIAGPNVQTRGSIMWEGDSIGYKASGRASPRGACIGTFFSALCRFFSALCRAIWVTFAFCAIATAATPDTTKPRPQAYLLRGTLNIFSLGLDGLAGELEARGIPASTSNYLSWRLTAASAAEAYKSGRTKQIILIGHSGGGDSVIDIAEELGRQGVPVALAVTLDTVSRTIRGGQVNQFYNFYISQGMIGGTITQGPGFRGALHNVDVRDHGVTHFTIDKDLSLHNLILQYVAAAIRGGPPAGKPTQSAAKPAASPASGARRSRRAPSGERPGAPTLGSAQALRS
jgi:hypothetical protein